MSNADAANGVWAQKDVDALAYGFRLKLDFCGGGGVLCKDFKGAPASTAC